MHVHMGSRDLLPDHQNQNTGGNARVGGSGALTCTSDIIRGALWSPTHPVPIWFCGGWS